MAEVIEEVAARREEEAGLVIGVGEVASEVAPAVGREGLVVDREVVGSAAAEVEAHQEGVAEGTNCSPMNDR